MKIKFGTDGWRAIIGKGFTVNNVARVSIAVGQWLNQKYDNPSVVIGYDCRFGGLMFAETTAKVMQSLGIKTMLCNGFASTPMVSLGVLEFKATIGVVITASHNPHTYNGFKLKADFGGPMLPHDVQEIENIIPDENHLELDALTLDGVEMINLESMYVNKVKDSFDLDCINNADLNLAYDGMYGAGQRAVPLLLPQTKLLHCTLNPGFNGVAPEPIHRNLEEFSQFIKNNNIDCGLATDGDADRLGLFNSKGEFVDSHHIILLLIHYLAKYKNQKGKVVTAFSCSVKVAQLCAHYGLEHETVKIGFKYVAGVMLDEDNVILGGEESGGVAVADHIPERDGIWMGLILWEFMAKTGKSLDELIKEVYDIVGSFAFERIDLHLNESKKLSIVENCKSGVYKNFGDLKIYKVEDIDGYKFYFDEDRWVMIRPSGTEPVLRTYCEARTQKECFDLLEKVHKVLLR